MKSEGARKPWDFVYDGKGLVKKPDVVVTYRAKGELTLTDNKLFSYLLHRAWRRLENATQRIPTWDALTYCDIKKPETLIESLRRLGQVYIEINYVAADGEPHSALMHFLSFDSSRAQGGILEYAFDPILLPFLKDPRIFAKLSLNDERNFKTLGGFRLYEVMLLRDGRNYDRVWRATLDEVKTVLGCTVDQEWRWDNFRKRILEPAIDECNRYAPFTVEVKYLKTGKTHSVSGLELTPVPKKQVIDYLAPVRSKPAPSRPKRDDATIDIWDRKTDRERESLIVISDEAMEKAHQLVAGTDLDIEDLERGWREAMVGRSVADADGNFLTWVMLKVRQKNGSVARDDDDDALGDFLNGR